MVLTYPVETHVPLALERGARRLCALRAVAAVRRWCPITRSSSSTVGPAPFSLQSVTRRAATIYLLLPADGEGGRKAPGTNRRDAPPARRQESLCDGRRRVRLERVPESDARHHGIVRTLLRLSYG